MGRGQNIVSYPGNVKYRETVLQHRDEYLASRRILKGGIAQRVIDCIWMRGGRFLEYDGRSKWRESELSKILDKTTQALREKFAWKEHPNRPKKM